MSKYSDMVALLEYMERNREKKPKRETRSKDPDDPFTTLIRLKNTADQWKKFLEEQEKLGKKDDKKPKDGWESMSFVQKVTILTMTVPLFTMGGILSVLLFAKAVVRIMT